MSLQSPLKCKCHDIFSFNATTKPTVHRPSFLRSVGAIALLVTKQFTRTLIFMAILKNIIYFQQTNTFVEGLTFVGRGLKICCIQYQNNVLDLVDNE